MNDFDGDRPNHRALFRLLLANATAGYRMTLAHINPKANYCYYYHYDDITALAVVEGDDAERDNSWDELRSTQHRIQ